VRHKMKSLLGILCFISLLLVSGCGGSVNFTRDSVTVTPSSAAVAANATFEFTGIDKPGKFLQWSVNGVLGGNAQIGFVDSQGRYTAPSEPPAQKVIVMARGGTGAFALAAVHVIAPSKITASHNPQVALYTVTTPDSASATVEFGPDTSYGIKTSPQPSSPDGHIRILVAGMKAFSTYHMRATVQFGDGSQFVDGDQTFTTDGLQGTDLPAVVAQTTPGMVPQTGIELVNTVLGPSVPVYATDLNGNVIWSYKFNDGSSADLVYPVQFLSNGHFVVLIGPNSPVPIQTPPPAGTIDVLREIDLAGNTVRELSIQALNTRLAAKGFKLNAALMHHEVLPLPNGHWLVLVNEVRALSGLTGLASPVNVLGDGIVDLDSDLQPVWIWSSFDHLDVNRHPMQFPDWTHANALVYLHEDGNLLLSMRHQNWIIKIDYANGAGTGDVLWKLGEQGDFSLVNFHDPTDWFYAQHGPAVFDDSSTGVFSLSVMDNGNDRDFPPGESCATSGIVSCPYSSGAIYRIDEDAKTATVAFHFVAQQFSNFGGFSLSLKNGDIEFDFCAFSPAATIYEFTRDPTPQLVWQMNLPGQFAYRAFRLPSLYPGVQW
jgi:arylsulfate sulfotransferase